MIWETDDPDALGFLPMMLDENDPRPARDQFDAAYQHGGGWRPFEGFQLHSNDTIEYPGDPPYHPIGRTQLRDETIIVYQHAWVAIIQPNRSYEIARMD